MRASTKISFFGAAGLLVLFAGTLMAQETGTRATRRDRDQGQGQGQEATARQHAQGGMAGQQDAQLLIGHAVMMAISGTALKEEAQKAGAQAGQGQGQAGQGQGRAGQGQGQGQDPAQQLMLHARKAIQDSQRLLQGAGRDQGAQRLQTAANQYIKTLYALCGESSGQGSGASSRDEASETGQARTGRSSRDQDLGGVQASQGGKNLSARDKAAICLINHSVKEAIAGTQLTQVLQSRGAGSSASELLQRHAREMASEGRESLQKFLGSSQTGARAGAGRGDDEQASSKAGGAAGGQQQGEASVMTLARQGQELIQAFQSGAQGGSGRPGTQGRDREGGAPGAGRTSDDDTSSGSGRGSGADRQTNPR